MKKLVFLLTISLALISCKKEDDIVKYDVMIRGKESVNIRKGEGHLTPVEISKQAFDIALKQADGNNGRGAAFVPELRDTVNGILKRWASDVIRYDNTIVPDFITGRNIVIERYFGDSFEGDHLWAQHLDTIGYIPNAVIETAQNRIMAAYEQEDWQGIYNIFNESFVFLPITGAEYRELEKAGTN